MIGECDTTVYRAGWSRECAVGPAQLGTTGYSYEIPQRRMLTEYRGYRRFGLIGE